MDNKECVACRNTKTADEFYKDKRMKSGLSSECKECVRARNKEYLKTYDRHRPSVRKNPILTDEEKKHRKRNARLTRTYGISAERYSELYEKQEGKCAICDIEYETLHVDHCHSEGIVRGLLCFNCNTGLGKFFDSIPNLENAIKYLKNSGQK
jgi:hypothetical protein